HAVLNDFTRHMIEVLGVRFGPDAPIKTALIIQFIEICMDDRLISSDEAADWLQVNPRSIERTILRNTSGSSPSLVEGIDFIKKKNTKQISPGPKRQLYYLTSDGFQKICMQSQSASAGLIRSYFVAIHTAYRENFMDLDGTRRAVDRDRNLDPDRSEIISSNIYPNAQGSFIYAAPVKGTNHQVYKIGQSRKFQTRSSNLRYTNPNLEPIELALQFPDAQ